ncbi:MAG: LacI family DNA-binding transcriptional regulator, partial [Rhizobiales bacterium]|nr:LacI family DNA-binding transcriptional regulator [Hyphomicrobiales bacterium]
MASTRVTIQDLADRLGLSKFSVSRALSGKPGVAESTRSRVLQAARAMGYRAHAETAHPVGQILFVRSEVDPVSSELWFNIMQGAEIAARSGVPVVCASYVEPLVRFDHVVGADWESGVAVARMLTGLGHRHVAFIH